MGERNGRITLCRRLLQHPLVSIVVLISTYPTIAFSPTFVPSKFGLHSKPLAFLFRTSETSYLSSSPTALFAKKKDSKAAALAALESLDLKDDEPLSKKELLAQAKGKKKAVIDLEQDGSPKKKDGKAATLATLDFDGDEPLSLKEQMELAKAAAKKKSDSKEQDPPPKAVKDVKAASLAALELLDDEDVSSKKLSKKELRAQAAGITGTQDYANGHVNGQGDSTNDDDSVDAHSNGLHEPELSKKDLSNLQNEEKVDESLLVASGEKIMDHVDEKPAMSRKEANLLRALELEERDSVAEADRPEDTTPKLSNKELKALQKKEEKLAKQLATKLLKKQAKKDELENKVQADGADDDEGDDEDEADATTEAEDDDSVVEAQSIESDVLSDDESNEEESEQAEDGITLEEKIRKERPPPRIRVMESTQPGYTSLRLENVGITFRNQVVLKDVTWGVQTGDRIGLVGANGAGKTTQLRILAGELEPTTGDVVKSSKDLRVAILRQEFVDELDPSRTLKEEFFTVFDEENQILKDLRSCELQLENLGSSSDTDLMQEILDRMQELQAKADNKGVYALESRVQKVLNLMGFTEEEADDLVGSFSGGWKMRIGLGKVLLKDPNVLLLGKIV